MLCGGSPSSESWSWATKGGRHGCRTRVVKDGDDIKWYALFFFSGLFHGNLLLHVILVGMNGNTWEYKTTSSGPWTIIWGWELMFWSTTINIWDHPSINGWYIWLFGKPIVKSIYIKKEPGVECGIHPFRPPKMPQKERSSTQQKFRLEVGIT